MDNQSNLFVDEVKTTGFQVNVHYHCEGRIGNYLTEEVFTIQYNSTIDQVPESILVIPFLSNVLPIAWITDSAVYCKTIDKTFLNCLDTIKASFQKMYPNFDWKGKLFAETITDNQTNLQKGENNTALFFSGGIDSTASYTQLKEKKPALISVWGADISTDNEQGWKQVVNEINRFASTVGSDVFTIKSNFRDIINYQKLQDDYRFGYGYWWVDVQHGLGMIGLAAPVTYQKKVNNLYFAASHNPNFNVPCASHPTIDEYIRWGSKSFKTHHHCYILRSEKVLLLKNYITDYYPDLQIRVCFKSKDGRNCSECPKCYGAIIFMLLAGLDPGKHGFNKIDKLFLEKIRSGLEDNGWIHQRVEHRYIDMKNQITKRKEGLPEFSRHFFNWLENADLKKIQRRYQNRQKWYAFKGKVKNTLDKVM